MRNIVLIGVFAFVVALSGCRPTPQTAQENAPPADDGSATKSKLFVFVSIPPQAYFVERVGGEMVDVQVLVPPGQSPATYEPTPMQMSALAKADVFFRIGVPFETALMERIEASMPDLNVVDMRQGVPLRTFGAHKHVAADWVSERDGGANDPHIWLAPRLVEVQIQTIAEELARLDPPHAESYYQSMRQFRTELQQLHHELEQILPAGGSFLVYHPSWGYFADEFGLKQVVVEVEGKEPGPRRLQQIIEWAREHSVNTVFVEPQFATASARSIAREIGAEVVSIDPLARDWMDNLREVARKIAAASRKAAEATPPGE